MSTKLQHRHVNAVMTELSEAKILDLDAPIRNLVNPIAESLAKSNAGSEVGIHVLCCNEYALVTGLEGGGIAEVEQLADSIRLAIQQGQKG